MQMLASLHWLVYRFQQIAQATPSFSTFTRKTRGPDIHDHPNHELKCSRWWLSGLFIDLTLLSNLASSDLKQTARNKIHYHA